MNDADEKERERAVSEAARLARLMTDQIIPLFPPSFKLVIMGRDENEEANESARIFLTNETPSAMEDLIIFLRKNMTACAVLDKQVDEGGAPIYYPGFGDGTVN